LRVATERPASQRFVPTEPQFPPAPAAVLFDLDDTLLIEDRLVPSPGAIDALERLRRDGIPAAAVSNTSLSARVLWAELGAHGLTEYLAFVLSSADIGVRKPNEEIFDAALQKLGLPRDDVWFVGDTWSEDIVGALGAGLCAIWLSPTKQLEWSRTGVWHVRDWTAFLSLYANARAPR
jgi:putative hydrolase of the HAD superfamily